MRISTLKDVEPAPEPGGVLIKGKIILLAYYSAGSANSSAGVTTFVVVERVTSVATVMARPVGRVGPGACGTLHHTDFQA